MADKLELSQTSKEEVAFKLFQEIIISEGRPADRQTIRKYMLDTYAECLTATRGLRDWKEK
ncbi:MAG TPA: hypothetical protein EYG02_14840 [Henriciella marina]|uniref:hypothetical protein n=1 Tax=Henriciella sp. TaxID=1968823 RepID=UPI00184749F8|nr:hypothetical protein [Henriciella sp.]HIG21981.1 hypothetical protein [Henriciella sp.]HIK66285.1 hypothetical protein [Henriciella marina]